MHQEQLINLTKSAYKKLKSAAYFDKTRPHLQNHFVDFERDINLAESRIIRVTHALNNKELLNTLLNEITESISVLIYPKTINSPQNDTEQSIIWNAQSNYPRVNKTQAFIDMNIEGFLIGVLWVLIVGVELDKKFDDYICGNRIRKNIREHKTQVDSLSPYIFEPYFSQYEKWRDTALDITERSVIEDKSDAVLITADISSFYYSVDLNDEFWKDINSIIDTEVNSDYVELAKMLNNAVSVICKRYSTLIDSSSQDENIILPIGFEPSHILANQYLKEFDYAILNAFSPLYYGRYVDDIIVVLKKNNYKNLRDISIDSESITVKHVFEMFESCKILDSSRHSEEYQIDAKWLKSEKAKLIIKEKTKVFVLTHESPISYIKKFRKTIARNASQFDLMPNINSEIIDRDFSFLYSPNYNESPNKIRDIQYAHISSFELSKLLGQTAKIFPLINQDDRSLIASNLFDIFDSSTLIDNYKHWEKILLIFLLSGNVESTNRIIKKIANAINNLKLEKSEQSWFISINSNNKSELEILKTTLKKSLSFFLSKNLALLDCDYAKQIKNIEDQLIKESVYDNKTAFSISFMLNKYMMPVDPFFIYKASQSKESFYKTNLTDIHEFLSKSELSEDSFTLSYLTNESIRVLDVPTRLPYIVKNQDIQTVIYFDAIARGKVLSDPKDLNDKCAKMYDSINFGISDDSEKNMPDIEVIKGNEDIYKSYYIVPTSEYDFNKLNVAIVNIALSNELIQKSLTAQTTISYKRYQTFAQLISNAKHEKVNILVFPELSVPIDWLPLLIQFSAKNGMAIVAGLEYIINSNNKVYNLTATILPYTKDNTFRFANVTLHQKVHFAPEEMKLIHDYDCSSIQNSNFESFCWNSVWFSVYCCFELASPKARLLFESLNDIVVGVEWNKDIDFYDSLANALVRDMSCFFVQANNSCYGDSRILAPRSRINKNIVRFSGSKNATIQIGQLNIEELRNAQCTDSGGGKYKPPSPNFNHEIAKMKLKKEESVEIAKFHSGISDN